MKIHVAGHQVIGESVSGIGTAVCFPSLAGGVVFDMGVCPRDAIGCPTVFLTHGHLDHWAAILTHASTREMMGMSPSHFICPPWMRGPIDMLFDAAARAEGHEPAYKLTILSAGDEVPVAKGYVARAFTTDHTLSSQGYLLVSKKSKLKPEYFGMPGPEIAKRRKEGAEVSDIEEVIAVAYIGDTQISAVQRNAADVKRAKLIVAEATFMGDTTLEFAHDRGHTHLSEIAALAPTFGEGHVLLTHFSARYSDEEIVQAVTDQWPPAWQHQVTPFVEGWE